ncbi:hypothetical protein [Saccharicrinis sp. GN24d3]|uniref:hypothetical protein n=1 Tax=Saccharicrinis sp. GN24d3 TaxID=3458416 RepID=UPI00403744A7
MDYKIITNKKKNTTQIRIPLDSSKIAEPEFGSLMLSAKYEHLLSKQWTLGHFKLDTTPGVFLLIRADGYVPLVKEASLELVYSFYKMPSGGIFGIFLHVDSKKLAGVSPHGFPVFECLLGLDYHETIDLIAEALEQYKVHLCVADKSPNAESTVMSDSGDWIDLSNPECIFDLVQEITPELRSAIIENFKDLLMYHAKSPGNFQQSMHELDELFPTSESPLLEPPKPGFFQRLFGNNKSKDIIEANPFDEKKKHLVGHMETQYPKLTNVPDEIIERYRKTFDRNLDNIVRNITDCELKNNDSDFEYFDEETCVYLFVSVFNKPKEQVTDYYVDISTEPDFAYLNFYANQFLNNWPSTKLRYLMHLIVCNSNDGSFQIHNAVSQYGGSPKARGDFIVFPIDILTENERVMLFNN